MRGAAPGNAPRTRLEQVMSGIAGTRKTQSAPNTLSLPRNMHLGLGRTPGYWSEAVFGVNSSHGTSDLSKGVQDVFSGP